MLMPKKHRVAIYEYLFKEGVLVAKKEINGPKHKDVANIPNLHVIKALQSLKSKGYVKEQFSWRHYYWYLTNEGIQYLRDFLHLPPEIVPATLKRQQRTTETSRPRPRGMDGGGPSGPSRAAQDRESYRRAPGLGADKKSDVGMGMSGQVEFRGGFGRGRGMMQ